MAIAILTVFLSYWFEFSYDVDLTLLSIAIVFPLVFTIRGSFRRREKALEHLSKFRSALKTVNYFVLNNLELPQEDKNKMEGILSQISSKTILHLGGNFKSTKELDEIINSVNLFMLETGENVSPKLKDRVFRFMKDLHESIENLHAINIHRTPITLKAYCKVFIYIFPFIYAPTIIFHVGPTTPQGVSYFIVLLTQFILISLYNIQDQLEYPFDDDGLDDVNLENFRIDR
ncbi:hypothetical protein LVD13_14150 [Flavobacteriaceae bacterium D16]|nr:hypothetical protein [Flavobacteriaceae bacterium D16]